MSFIVSDKPLTATEEGVWVEYMGSKFKVAYATNNRFLRIKQRLEQPHRRKIEAGTLDPVEQKALLSKAMAEGILLDWSGVNGQDGKVIPHTREMALQALSNDESFREFIMECSVNIQNFKDEDRDTSGNG